MRGTSRRYLIDRLRRERLNDLADAVESGRVSAYAVGCELGWIKRQTLGVGSANESKRRRYRLAALGVSSDA